LFAVLLCTFLFATAESSQKGKGRTGSHAACPQDKNPIRKAGLLEALRLGGLTTSELIAEISQRGVDFKCNDSVAAELRAVGAEPRLLEAVRETIAPAKQNYGSCGIKLPRDHVQQKHAIISRKLIEGGFALTRPSKTISRHFV
jgi:hypothetical protein